MSYRLFVYDNNGHFLGSERNVVEGNRLNIAVPPEGPGTPMDGDVVPEPSVTYFSLEKVQMMDPRGNKYDAWRVAEGDDDIARKYYQNRGKS